ncbi:MAG: LTA synthase family protein [Pseudobdellovibrionaceae bacterium]
MLKLTVAESLKYFFKWLCKLLTINAFYLVFMSCFRFAALLIYGQSANWTMDLWKAFALGLRFDGSVLGYLLALPTLYLIIAAHLRSENFYHFFSRWVRPYYFLFFSLIGILLAIDTKYYSYFQDHFNILVFALVEDDTKALLLTFWRNYPVIWYLLITALCLFCLFHLLKRSLKAPDFERSFEKVPWLVLPLVSLVALVFVFFLGRGSFGLFPLTPADSVVSRDPFINYLPSNGVHALYRSFKLRRQQNAEWDNNLRYFGYQDAKEAFADYFRLPLEKVPENPLELFHHQTPVNEWAEKKRPHVVVLMMESFGAHWLRYQSKDFNLLGEFEKHIQQDLFLKNFLPSASSTTGSLSSLMISVAHRPIGAFLTESQYLQVPFRSSPARIFAKAGYETRFIYGGNPGWRDMDKFARHQGFQYVEGDVDIEAKLGKFKEVHDWGIYDEDVFRYVLTILKEAEKPQMILVMTTTNHPPYQIPSDFKVPEQKFPDDLKGRLVGEKQIIENRFKTYYYSNQKLGEFLSTLKSSPLAERTFVAATGDHGFLLINFSDEEILQKWSVPFYLYTPPELNLKLSADTFGSHMDIFPTLYHLSLSNADYDALGVNLFDLKAPHYALHSSGLVVGPAGGALMLGKSNASYFDWAGKYEKLVPAEESPERKAMAIHYKSLMSLLDFYFMQEKNNKTNSTKF